MNDKLVRTSKFLSLILRHDPARVGLTLDENGWANVDELLQCINDHGHSLSLTQLQQVVIDNAKQRFAFNETGSHIRANQGHSIKVDLELRPRTPPAVLFHGTASRFLDSIRRSGLKPGNRQHVHMSVDHQTAISVGQRHGKPVVLQIDAQSMAFDSFDFFLSDNSVWLTDQVPPEYVTFP